MCRRNKIERKYFMQISYFLQFPLVEARHAMPLHKTNQIYIFRYFFYIFFCIIKNIHYFCVIILNHKEQK
jgi:hypothetical protein